MQANKIKSKIGFCNSLLLALEVHYQVSIYRMHWCFPLTASSQSHVLLLLSSFQVNIVTNYQRSPGNEVDQNVLVAVIQEQLPLQPWLVLCQIQQEQMAMNSLTSTMHQELPPELVLFQSSAHQLGVGYKEQLLLCPEALKSY